MKTGLCLLLTKILAGVASTMACLYMGMNLLMFGRLLPASRVDTLRHPVKLVTWTADGLSLSDGRRIMPKGMTELPAKSFALTAIAERGLEVDSDGSVYGLLRLFHGCGNDPVKYDIRKIDVGQFLAYLREGSSNLKLNPAFKPYMTDEQFNKPFIREEGWPTSDFVGIKLALDPQLDFARN